jgi:hypothetical protein
MTYGKRILTGTLLCAVSIAAHADHCYGTIRALNIDSGGNVTIYGSFGGWFQVCNLTSVWKAVDPIVCKSWTAVLTTLRATQEQTDIAYSSATCSTLPHDGATPAPLYVGYYLP